MTAGNFALILSYGERHERLASRGIKSWLRAQDFAWMLFVERLNRGDAGNQITTP